MKNGEWRMESELWQMTGKRTGNVPVRFVLLVPGLVFSLGLSVWGQSASPLERPVLSNRSLLGRADADTSSPAPATPRRSRSMTTRSSFRFTPRTAPPGPAMPAASVSPADVPATSVAAPSPAWVSTGEGTPWNPFRLRPVAPPPAPPAAAAATPLPGLLRQSERRYWESRARLVAQQEQVPAWLFLRLIRQESGFNPRARSPVGAIGLTQLMPDTARSLGVNPHDPEQNLRGGARYLRQMLHRFRGHIPSALASYNAGPVAVEAYQRGEARRVGNKVINAGRRVLPIPPYRETRQYVASILGGVPWRPTVPVAPGPPSPPPVVAAEPPPTLRRTGRIYLAAGGTALVTTGHHPETTPEPESAPPEARRSLRPALTGAVSPETSPESPEALPAAGVPPAETPQGAAAPEIFSPKTPGMVRNLPNRSIYIVQPGGRP